MSRPPPAGRAFARASSFLRMIPGELRLGRTPVHTAGTEWVGRVIGKFRVEAVLGRGSTGPVYRAVDQTLGRPAAVKITAAGDDDAARARLLREARTAAALQHPALLTVLGVEEADGCLLVFSELAAKGTLAGRGAVKAEQAVRAAAAIARGLAFAHRSGVVHRDVKPSNIYLGEGGAVKLGDFGLARSLEESRRLTRGPVSTDRLMHAAPELLRGEPAGAPGDIYALGCVLYRLLTGSPPFSAQTIAELVAAKDRGPADPRSLRPDLPGPLAAAAMQALAADGSARFASADGFADALRPFAGRKRTTASAPGRPVPPTPAPASPAIPTVTPESGSTDARPLPADRKSADRKPADARPTLPEGGSAETGVRTVAGYEILGELGRGGMGVVYKARDRRLGRVVALKMLLAGGHAASEDARRFRTEAEAVAALAHPNIVRLYEAGEADGLPYFALEFCAGGPLDKRLAGRPQNPRQAAALLAAVARAVQSAHEAGVVHRDLKPGNILLDEKGLPKVADFGLAKRIDSGVSGPTGSHAMMGTPAYMAPEQMGGAKNVGPAADVYALGAVLYEMLTGRPPFLGESEVHMIYLVSTQDPVSVRQLQPKVPADLETVCLKCLAKEPGRRYRTAAEFAEDLEAYLDNRPIKARPAGSIEKAVRWVRRNPAWAALGAVSAAAVVALTAGAVAFAVRTEQDRRALEVERDRAVAAERSAASERDRAVEAERVTASERDRAVEAERRAAANFEESRKVLRECLDLARDHPVFQRPGMQEARELLLRAAAPFHDRFAEVGGTRELRTEAVMAKVAAALQSAETKSKPEAIELYRRCIPELEGLAAETPGFAGYRETLATVRQNLGNLLHETGDRAAAEHEYRTALREALELAKRFPDVVKYQVQVAADRQNLGILLRENGDVDGAEREWRLSLEPLEELNRRRPAAPEVRVRLAAGHESLGVLCSDLGRVDEAKSRQEEALRLRRELAAERPGEARYRSDLATAQMNMGVVLRSAGELRAAGSALTEAVRILQALSDENPAVVEHRALLATAESTRGLVCRESGDLSGAEAAHRRSVQIRKELAARNPKSVPLRFELASGHNNLGALLGDLGRTEEALREFGEALRLRQALADEFPGVEDYRARLGATHNNIAIHLKSDPAGAQRAHREAIRLLEGAAAVEHRMTLAVAHAGLAGVLRAAGDRTGAIDQYRAAIRVRKALFEQNPTVARHRNDLARAHHTLALVLWNARGRDRDLAGAEAEFRASLDLWRPPAEANPGATALQIDLGGNLVNLARLAIEDGRAGDALALVDEAVGRLEKAAGAAPDKRGREYLRNAYWTRADGLVRLGRHSDAAADYRRALSNNSDPAIEKRLRAELARVESAM